jgi:integrase
VARAYDEGGRCYRMKALGDFSGIIEREKFAAAKKHAEEFADLIEAGGTLERQAETVADACRRYAERSSDAVGRFKRYVYDDAIAELKLSKLRRSHLRAWRDRLENRPAMVSRRKRGEQTTRPRAPSSVNRDMAVLRAALNRVLAPGAPDTEAAWQEALKPIRNADRQRTLYLDRAERRALLAEADEEIEPFLRALCLLPLRPGATAALSVSDFDRRTSELTIGKDKSGKPRRVLLSAAAASLFEAGTDGKAPGDPVFIRLNGKRWSKDSWGALIVKAAGAAKLPAGTTAYTLRHSTITDLVNGGLPLLAVAQISDTSVEMIERHYGHLCRTAAAEALSGLAL